MKAIHLREFGGPEVLVADEAPDPEPDEGQVLVEVEYANITFIDTQHRANGFGPFGDDLPMIPGNGVGGVVSSVGSGVDEDLVGRRVIAITGGSGGYAELAAMDVSQTYEVPDGLEMDVAVAMLADGRTATMLVRKAGIREGDVVLVEAAAGSLGTLIVQLARDAGARVIAAVGGRKKADRIRDLGAELIVDYEEAGWTERVRESVGELDAVFDGVGGDIGRSAFGLLEDGGRMFRYGLSSGAWTEIPEDEAKDRNIELLAIERPTPEEAREYTESSLARAAEGRLVPVIGQTFPLERAADAHAAIESRATVGKTLLEIRR